MTNVIKHIIYKLHCEVHDIFQPAQANHLFSAPSDKVERQGIFSLTSLSATYQIQVPILLSPLALALVSNELRHIHTSNTRTHTEQTQHTHNTHISLGEQVNFSWGTYTALSPGKLPKFNRNYDTKWLHTQRPVWDTITTTRPNVDVLGMKCWFSVILMTKYIPFLTYLLLFIPDWWR